MKRLSNIIAACTVALLSSSVLAETITLPNREGPRPETTNSVPHLQFGLSANKELSAQLLGAVDALPGVELAATRLSLAGAVGFQLDANLELARPDSIVGGREFAHLHPDGSLHASLDPEVARAAVEAGWAIPHPWAGRRKAWAGFVMIYTPRTQAELDVVIQLIQNSYEYVVGVN